jgi:DNA-binding CsgD family transcriptional regulator
MLEALNLTADEEAVYLALLDRARVPADDLAGRDDVDDAVAALASLEARGLVAACSDVEGAYRAAGPQATVYEALRDAEQTLANVKASVGALSHRLARGQSAVPSLSDVECVLDSRQALARAAWWRGHASKELRIVDPVGVTEDDTTQVEAAPRFGSDLDVRGIYGQAVVDDPEHLGALKWGMANGEQVRTLSSVPVKLTLVDSAAAIVPLRSSNRYRDGIMVIRHTRLLDAFVDYFEVLWSMAIPLDAFRAVPQGTLDADDRTVLTLMAAGFSDQTIGRRLGVSEAAAQSRVGEVIKRMGADNRFQAGVQAARLGLLF